MIKNDGENEIMYNNNKIAIVIPAYNEENLIGITIHTVPDYIDKIYAVDDASIDNTFKIICEAADNRNKVIPIRHEINAGVGGAIVSGYKKSLQDENDIIVVMAGDNQMDPEYLPVLLEPIIRGEADYTKGNRLKNKGYSKGMSTWRYIGNKILTFLTKISTGYWDVSDPQNGYTAISSNALTSLDLDSIYRRYGYCNDLLAKLNAAGFKVKDVSIPARYKNEKSKIVYPIYIYTVSILLLRNFITRIKLKYLTSRIHPLGIMYFCGLFFVPLGVVLELLSIIMKMINARPFLFIVPSTIFIFGFILIILAISLDTRIKGTNIVHSKIKK